MTDTSDTKPLPQIAELDFSDLKVAFGKGMSDFRKAPIYGIVFGTIFAALGVVLYLQFVVWQSDISIIPLAAGFPLIGPFVAVGMYEVSRLLERGESVSWMTVAQAIYAERKRQIPSIAFVVLFIFLIWVYMAHLVFALSFGLKPLTNVMTSADILLTKEGITMLLMGTVVGGFLSFVLFSVTVIGIPLLVDREIDVVTAMITSFSLVLNNLVVMLSWGAIVGVLLLIAMTPIFMGLIVVLPVLGHATWHLYKLAILPEE
ncbi:hypothetical protein A9Q96_07370 [Rhodobacterales bacterium 52_120_T64]|nr:hypothetical protein A9Q96_07370 [Rhodobacterales bacterium 52_120_T64]